MFRFAVDSFYEWVKARIIITNPNRIVKGIFNAQDWPPKRIEFDSFYLLLLGEEPVGRAGFSPSTPIVFHTVQWVWINQGTDVATGVRQANRGNRYSTAQQMKQELLYGLFPNYAPKLQWSFNGTVYTGKPLNPPEAITWTPAAWHEKQDKDSGNYYCSASTRIQDMTDTIDGSVGP